QAVGYVLAPRVALSGDQKGATLTLQVHRLLMLAMVAAVVVLTLCAPLLPYIYGPAFAASILPMILCLPGLALWGIANHVWNQFFLGSGRSGHICLVLAAALTTMVALDLALIPALGVPGAAVAYSLGAFASYATGFVLFRRATGRSLAETFLLRRSDLHLLTGLLRRGLRTEHTN
ncbi:MAG: hypothetical protein J7M26_06890, partial [Armatimonadetes bacterium]|nr:hypothetical protein [Armatimonadota bacterium]